MDVYNSEEVAIAELPSEIFRKTKTKSNQPKNINQFTEVQVCFKDNIIFKYQTNNPELSIATLRSYISMEGQEWFLIYHLEK